MIGPAPVSIESLRPCVDPNLWWTYPDLGPNQNGWDLASMASDSFLQIGTERTDWDILVDPWLEAPGSLADTANRLVERFKQSIELEAEALQHARWIAPAVPDLLSASDRQAATPSYFSTIRGHRIAAQVLAIRANLSFYRNNEITAARDLVMISEIGGRFAQGDGLFMDHLVGLSIERIADRSIQGALKFGRITDQTANLFLHHLPDRPDASRLAGCLRREFHDMFIAKMASFCGNPRELVARPVRHFLSGHPNPFDLPQTVIAASSAYKSVCDNMSLPYGSRQSLETILAPFRSQLPDFMTEDEYVPPKRQQASAIRAALRLVDNPIGKLIVATVLPVFENGQTAELSALAHRRATRYLLQYSLNPATPLPPDPFSSEPFRLDKDSHEFWSAGPNGDGMVQTWQSAPSRFAWSLPR